MFCVRLDTARSKVSPHNSPSTTAAATTVDRCSPSPRDRSSSARRTSSPAKYPGLGKSSSVSGKSSPAASPLADSSRRRRAADHRNSPHRATNGLNCSAGDLDCDLGVRTSRHSVRCDGVQASSSSSVTVIDSRLKPAEHPEEHPAIHSVTRREVLAGRSESQLKQQSDRRIVCNTGDKNGNRRQQSSDPASSTANTNTTTTAAAAAAADDGYVKLRYTEPTHMSTDINCQSQVCQ